VAAAGAAVADAMANTPKTSVSAARRAILEVIFNTGSLAGNRQAERGAIRRTRQA
jgi:hypothetical protein